MIQSTANLHSFAKHFMSLTKLATCSIAVITVLGAQGAYGRAPATQSTRPMGIVSSYGTIVLVQKVVSVEEDQDNQSLFVQVDNVTRGGAKTQTYALNTGETYRIYAVGDQQRIRDIDLAVYSPSGSYIIEDSDSSNIALVQFTARSTGYYTLKITPYSMASGIRDGFYGLVVVRVAGN